MSIWLGMALVPALLVGSMAALPRLRVSPETRRKLLHVEMGLVALAFPWLFASAQPVIGIAALSLAWLAAVRAARPFAARFGAVLQAGERDSLGDIYFVVGVCLTFLLARTPLAYSVAILVLALADTAAALVGQRYGRMRRMPSGARKSGVGSSAFFLVAFALTAGVLHAAGMAGPLRSALAVAVCATLIEALCGKGLDNLFVPLGTLAALELAHG